MAFEKVVWIGGSTGSGKSSIADYLAGRFGLLQHRLDRDEELAARVRMDARARGLKVVEVDGRRPLPVIATEVETQLFPAIKALIA